MLSSIELRHFRNHFQFSADIPENGCIFSGPNGSGKTSILEAIFLMASLKSFRLKSTSGCIQNGEEMFEITTKSNDEKLIFRCQSTPRKKTILIRNDAVLSTQEILQKKSFFAVLFCPEDLLLPFASPDHRRRFLNRVLVPVFSDHFIAIRHYEKILRSRNALLKRIAEGLAKEDELHFYDEQLAEQSEEITKKRTDFFVDIRQNIADYYGTISHSSDTLDIAFQPNVTGDVQAELNRRRKNDIFRGTTSCGAHLDDFSFFIRNQPLEENGSRGEVRSAILALKMSEKIFIQSATQKKPILLLDDVFSELDAHRRKHLMEMIDQMQTIITTTDVPSRAVKDAHMKIVPLGGENS